MQQKAIQAIEKLLQLIQLERNEEINQYESLLKNTTTNQRKAQGMTWYPITIVNEEIGIGGNLLLTFERSSGQDEPHKFRQGQTVALFNEALISQKKSNKDKQETMLYGIIQKIKRNSMQVVFNVEELPYWVDEGKLGINLLYNERTFKEMEKALGSLLAAKNNRLATLRDILLGFSKASFYEDNAFQATFPQLNDSQNKSLQQIAQAEDIALIHGPPGTGKTTTLVQAIIHTLRQKNKQVLVVAPSNTAVNLLTQKLIEQSVKALRMGHTARIDEGLLDYTLDAQVMAHRDYKQLKQLRKDAQKQRSKALKFKRVFDQEAREERKMLLKDAKVMLDDARHLEKYIFGDILNNAQVITATLVGAANRILQNRTFETVFIDEAAQALAPATFIPILKANRIVMAGDHWQLPPTVKSMDAQKRGLMKSLFERCTEGQGRSAATMLEVQYRMNEQIMDFSSEVFYEGLLKADASVKSQTLGKEGRLATPVDFVDTAGCGFTETRNPKTLSTFNKEEGQLLLKYLSLIINDLESYETTLAKEKLTIGIISPYKEQVLYLEDILDNYEALTPYRSQIVVNTVDGFQGQERDIIAISLVRSNDKGEIGFLSDTRRMNVAMTRAKSKLVMVGDSATLAKHRFYDRLLKYIERIDAYKSAWEFMY